MVLQENITVPHFVLFPFIAQGHIIPMIDIAKLLAQHGVIVTIFTTPKNASRFTSVLSRAVSTGLQIKLITLNFPSKQAGLPEGCENFDMIDISKESAYSLFHAVSLLHKSAEELFDKLLPKPNCIISDFCITWTSQIAEKHQIPRISFHGFSCFCLHCVHKVHSSKILESVNSDSEHFIVPGIPDEIQITKEQLPVQIEEKQQQSEFFEKMQEAEMKSYGEIINTFEELEKEYVNDYKKERNDKVWCVGPVSLCNKDDLDKAERGNIASISEQVCLKFLDLHKPKSVVYVCLGSLCNLVSSQLIELALGLEETKMPFIWAFRDGVKTQELEKWIQDEKFEERNKGRGLIIRGWAPQMVILSHPSIGGFLTHCGWNSILEGISVGVPLVTWPLFADQFLNEKLVTQVLKIGVSLGVEVVMQFGEEEKIGVVVKKEVIKEVICNVMNEGVKSKERRERASELSEMAKRAVEKGGSSYINITLLIQDIIELQSKHQS